MNNDINNNEELKGTGKSKSVNDGNNINSNINTNPQNEVSGESNNDKGNVDFVMVSNVADNSSEDLSHTVIQDADFTENTEEKKSHSENATENVQADGDKKRRKNKERKRKPAVGYVALALVCAIAGGGIGTAATYNAMQSKIEQAIDEIKESNSNGSSDTHISNLSGVSIPQIVDKVSSSVVGVATTSVSTNVFGFNMGEQQGIGSGVIFSEDGYVLTNYHVIENANQVRVIFSTGQEVAAKVVNYDADADLAVVKITEDVEMPGVAELGNSDNLKAGEDVIAIGNPLGKEYLGSVTNGIISAVNRDVDLSGNGKKTNLIQTNAAINPGNSGGPLINASGQVIGINTAKIQAEGVEGIGFAIPINDAIEKLDMLVKQKITLGISVINVDEKLSEQYKLPVGIYVKNVEDFSIAQKGGLQPGDVIVKFGGKTVKTVDELNEIKNGFSDGDTMAVEFIRQGQTMTANLVAE